MTSTSPADEFDDAEQVCHVTSELELEQLSVKNETYGVSDEWLTQIVEHTKQDVTL